MPTTADFLTAAQWAGISTLVCGVLAGISFLFRWGFRFRLVGVTGFMGVLTVGLFSLGLVPFTRTTIPGAVRFSTVYDTGATVTVIAVSPTITESQLTATLEQAASDLFSPGRLSRSGEKMTIRARTVIHPQPGVSKPLYLGEVRRSLATREDNQMEIKLYSDSLAQLPRPAISPEAVLQDS